MNAINLPKLKSLTLSKIISKLVLVNYHIAKSYHFNKFAHNENKYKKTPILVYQMGKVGSKSVTESLRLIVRDRLIYHFHILRPGRVDQYEAWRKKSFPDLKRGILSVWQWQYIYNQIQNKKRSNSKNWKIITLVRDPIAHNVADFFENMEIRPNGSDGHYFIRGVGSEVSQVYDYECSISKNDPKRLIDIFLNKYPHDAPLKYFDLEFGDVLGVDIYAIDFPKSKGYCIYKDKNYEILIIRLENLNECAQTALKDFLNIKKFTLVNKNIGLQKDYSDIYQNFKKELVFDDNYLDKIYNSSFSRHFYSDSEIEDFKSRWS